MEPGSGHHSGPPGRIVILIAWLRGRQTPGMAYKGPTKQLMDVTATHVHFRHTLKMTILFIIISLLAVPKL